MADRTQDFCTPDLERRMRSSLDAGKAAVIAKDGKIVCELEGRGVKPLLDALAENPDAFADAIAMDRIVGRAAAAIYIVGKATGVMAPVMRAKGRRGCWKNTALRSRPTRSFPASSTAAERARARWTRRRRTCRVRKRFLKS